MPYAPKEIEITDEDTLLDEPNYAPEQVVTDLRIFLSTCFRQDHPTHGLVERFRIGQLGGKIPAMEILMYIAEQASDAEIERILSLIPEEFEGHPLQTKTARVDASKPFAA